MASARVHKQLFYKCHIPNVRVCFHRTSPPRGIWHLIYCWKEKIKNKKAFYRLFRTSRCRRCGSENTRKLCLWPFSQGTGFFWWPHVPHIWSQRPSALWGGSHRHCSQISHPQHWANTLSLCQTADVLPRWAQGMQPWTQIIWNIRNWLLMGPRKPLSSAVRSL